MNKEIKLGTGLFRKFTQRPTLTLGINEKLSITSARQYSIQKQILKNVANQKSLLFFDKNSNLSVAVFRRNTSTTNNQNSSQNPSDNKQQNQQYQSVNIRLVPKNIVSSKIDYSRSYTANNFIIAVRAMNDYLLSPSDLDSLIKYKRRNPFDEYGQNELINVYLRSEVEAKALSIWGSLENLEKEKEKKKRDFDRQRQAVFNLKKSLRDYHNRIEELENPLTDKQYSNTTIFKTLSGKVVLSAVAINAMNFVVKLVGWIYSGSSSLFSEAVHSFADTINQLILAFGLHQSLKRPNREHPYGYSNMTYITSLISGVGIFCFGTGLSWYHGITGLFDPHPVESLSWALVLLLGSAFSESGTLMMAYLDTKQNAQKLGLSFWDYVAQGYKPSVNVVLLEDIAAVLGVFIAGTCMTITYYTGNPIADCVGSLLVGGVMGGVASFIIYTNTIALVGKSIPTPKINQISTDLESDIMIRSIHDVKATDLGGQTVMFKAEVDIDGREMTRSYLEKVDIEKLLDEINSVQNVQDVEKFMLKHGENIVDRVGAEIDRIERNLRKKYPDLRHVDLEVLIDRTWFKSDLGSKILQNFRHKEKIRNYGLLEKPTLSSPFSQYEEVNFKILLLGKSFCGKTTFIQSITSSNNEEYIETPGIQITHLYWPVKMVDSDKFLMFNLAFWDMGKSASIKYEYIQPSCVENIDCVIFVFSWIDRQSFLDIFELVKQYSSNDRDKLAMIIIGTKFDKIIHSDIESEIIEEIQKLAKTTIINFSSMPYKKRKRVQYKGHPKSHSKTEKVEEEEKKIEKIDRLTEAIDEDKENNEGFEFENVDKIDLNTVSDIRKLVTETNRMEMPEDFYEFFEFCKSINNSDPKNALKDIDIELTGIYDLIINGYKLNYSTHARYFYDPPEFQTILKVKKSPTHLHFGYYRDDPSELPNFVGINEPKLDCKILCKGDNLFAAINWYLEELISGRNYKTNSSQEDLKLIKTKFDEWCDRLKVSKSFSLSLKSPKIKSRDKKINATIFNTAGIVVPVDSKGFGYRDIPESYEKQKSLFKFFCDSSEDIQRKKETASERIQEIVTLIQFANDETDYGMGLEFGLNMFCFGDLALHKFIKIVLPVCYELLGRSLYSEILLEHLKNRKTKS
ncbi:unnamed protein product [Brachionus calyciflorus]|uniref:Proton-coupled zinc antiporter SLC30A9, mitochondrial n=1 Tax=Brachionus calyciflorus TaxID=104777 RepID=A0A813M473_9BILA|nr:unnamed protein product [Brachionus calyciflorus]